MVKEDVGIDLKKSQAHKNIRENIGGLEQHLAYFCIIRSYMCALADVDDEGRFVGDVAPLQTAKRSSSVSSAVHLAALVLFKTFTA